MKKKIKEIFFKLFQINDTPQKIACGLGVGVFSGIIPGTGPIAALFLATFLRVNRAAALLGSLATNTWLSIVTFFLSIKVGARIMRLDWQLVYQDWLEFLKDFRWLNLFKLSILKIILPVILGYVLVALSLGFVVYLITFLLIKRIRYENKGRTDLSR
jgi:uncharacterized protein (DUF2062 family)